MKAKLMILLPEHHRSSKQNPFSQSNLLTIKSLYSTAVSLTQTSPSKPQSIH